MSQIRKSQLSTSVMAVVGGSGRPKYQPTPTPSAKEAAKEENDIEVVPMGLSLKNGSRRIKLLVNTGSGRIVITGDADPADLPKVVEDLESSSSVVVETDAVYPGTESVPELVTPMPSSDTKAVQREGNEIETV